MVAFGVSLGVSLILAACGRRVAGIFRQPGVIGEVVAGVAFGAIVTAVAGLRGVIFPRSSMDLLGLIGTIGVCGYLLTVGYEFRRRALPVSRLRVLAIALAGLVASLVGGVIAGFVLLSYKPAGLATGAFALFLGVTMSITALPVLARVLEQRAVLNEPLALVALGSALVTDIVAVVLLTASIVWGEGGGVARLALAVVTLATLVAMGGVVRLGLRRVDRLRAAWCRAGATPLIAGVIALVVTGAAQAEIPFILTAFLLGAHLPPGRTSRDLLALGRVIGLVGLPIYFVYTGVRVSLTGVAPLTLCAMAAGLTVLSCAGKTVGTLAGAWRTDLADGAGGRLAVLLNIRGATELLILNIGLDAHLITHTVFSALVLMTLVTTIAFCLAAGRMGLSGRSARGRGGGGAPFGGLPQPLSGSRGAVAMAKLTSPPSRSGFARYGTRGVEALPPSTNGSEGQSGSMEQ